MMLEARIHVAINKIVCINFLSFKILVVCSSMNCVGIWKIGIAQQLSILNK
jgi:hypothetical protein